MEKIKYFKYTSIEEKGYRKLSVTGNILYFKKISYLGFRILDESDSKTIYFTLTQKLIRKIKLIELDGDADKMEHKLIQLVKLSKETQREKVFWTSGGFTRISKKSKNVRPLEKWEEERSKKYQKNQYNQKFKNYK